MMNSNTKHQRVLEFVVTGQKLTRKPGCDFSKIVAGSVGYLRAKFYFSRKEWADCKKAASFWVNNTEHAVLLDDDNSCTIPSEALVGRTFEISVTGARVDGLIPTSKITVYQEVTK